MTSVPTILMAEALALVGLVSAIVQFIEFGTEIASRLHEFHVSDVPKTFRDIKTELPLLLDTLQRTKEQAEAGLVSKSTQQALLPVVEGCRSQVELLNDTLVKALPMPGDDSWKRGMNAFFKRRAREEGPADYNNAAKLCPNINISSRHWLFKAGTRNNTTIFHGTI